TELKKRGPAQPISSAPPAHGIHAADRQKNAQKNETEIENHVRGIDHSAREIVVMAKSRKIFQSRGPSTGSRLGAEIEHPQQKIRAETQYHGNELAFGYGREKRTDGQQSGAQEKDSEIFAAQDAPGRGGLAMVKHVREPKGRGQERDNEQSERGKEYAAAQPDS